MIRSHSFRRTCKLILLLTGPLLMPDLGSAYSANSFSTLDLDADGISQPFTLLTKRQQLAQLQSTQAFKPKFSGKKRSSRRIPGGSRGNCRDMAIPLTPLIPIFNNAEQHVIVAQTVQERPVLWVYVPYSAADGVLGEFVLQNADGKTINRYEFTLPNQPGLMSFQLPQDAEPLAVNQEYRWYFKLFCGNVQTSTPLFVSGWIQRVAVSPDLNRQIKTNSNQAYKAYAAQNIWYDALNDLIKRRQAAMADPSVSRDWQQLLSLENVRLEALSQEPIIGNVILKIP